MTSPAPVATKSRRERVELMGPPEYVRVRVRGTRWPPMHQKPSVSGGNRAPRTRFLCQFPYRQLPDPLPSSREDRVAYRRGDRGRARLADAALRVGRRHDMHLHPRHVAHAEHEILMEVALLGAALVDGDLTPQRCREPIHDGAFHLGFDDAGG